MRAERLDLFLERLSETSFLLFFFSVEFGRLSSQLSFDLKSAVYTLTLIALITLPYFLHGSTKSKFSSWIFKSCIIASFGIVIGWMFDKSLAVLLPDIFRFLPMTLVILTATITFLTQFYFFIKLRLA